MAPPHRPAAPETVPRGHSSCGGRPGPLRPRRRVSLLSWTAWPPSFLLVSGAVSSSLLFSVCVLWAWAALLSVRVCFGSTSHYTALGDCLSSSRKCQRYPCVLQVGVPPPVQGVERPASEADSGCHRLATPQTLVCRVGRAIGRSIGLGIPVVHMPPGRASAPFDDRLADHGAHGGRCHQCL